MSLSTKMFHGMAWSAIERISVQAVQFILGIILARILSPKEYGIIGILLVFTAISNVFIDSGFTKALIQKQSRTKDDISTVFLFNIFISIVCYIALWLLAPYVENFYELEQLSILLRILALFLIINALFAVPVTLITIDLDFKTLTKLNFVTTIISGGIAVFMAYDGYGVWALVAQILIRSILTAILVWLVLKWRPNWVFSKTSLSNLFSYGSKLLISSLLSVTVNNFYALFIAKLISTKDLGYYTRGTQFTDVVYGILSSVLESVLLPGLSKVQEQREILIHQTRNIIKATAILVIPLFLFLAIMADPLVRVLLTEKWLPAVTILQIFCFARLITIISGINVNLLYVIGRTDLALKQQYSKILIRIIFLIAALKFGIIYIALAELMSTTIHFFINTYYPGKIMGYGAFSQLNDIKLIILAGVLMVVMVYCCIFFIESSLIQLFIAPILALPIYYGLLRLFKIQELSSLILKAKEFFGK
ncbi:O-antigen/teichoic acid export membrane protein [Maribacter polysiphoniae]|uniref:O-antigen/teichoic acid export membrane protein n=2 Tax=Maribacter polysiphoniae TaxID=429344 RepID=A0A316EDT0_9FLAO|nr:lipopolysaccharide biosynthesis protein [Maribacter polysiphoniae]PWK21120.1 O-antigen/teichoic acid export membrane protein [Maribacter polysiphoniae]